MPHIDENTMDTMLNFLLSSMIAHTELTISMQIVKTAMINGIKGTIFSHKLGSVKYETYSIFTLLFNPPSEVIIMLLGDNSIKKIIHTTIKFVIFIFLIFSCIYFLL